ncbi:hypothetical protein SDC9_207486 [bioreactor metagenome]|uniref:Uncharacterized protein n=1 Tax=bioreactor metagenome TaxID=1076179 RepID=A0A645JHD7_9ZZZZ
MDGMIGAVSVHKALGQVGQGVHGMVRKKTQHRQHQG